MLFGKDQEKGLRLNGFKLEVVTLGEDGIEESDILVHDIHQFDSTLHNMLIRMSPPHFPMALGIIRAVKAPTYDELVEQQYQESVARSNYKNVDELLKSGNTWEVK
jgi:2-oxoglutarate ferredoxin oxidoreductase subunit beta